MNDKEGMALFLLRFGTIAAILLAVYVLLYATQHFQMSDFNRVLLLLIAAPILLKASGILK